MERINIYGNKKFSSKEADVYVQNLIGQFKEYYSGLGYIEVPSVPITSGTDPTVRFIGSHISVLKHYLTDNNVPEPGVYIHQNCVRTRNVDKLLDDDFSPIWGSYFPSIGVLVPPGRLDKGSNEAFDFLENVLHISSKNLLVRISSEDPDLLKVARGRFGEGKVEVDSRNINYYRHKLGMPGIWGRNFNVALQKPDGSDEYSDVGNIILIESEDNQLGVEVALGTTTILKELYSLTHVQDCTPVDGLKTDNEAFRRKMEDVIITSCVLFAEGMKPSEQHNRNRILKKYIRAMSYFKARLELTHPQLEQIISDFATSQLSVGRDVGVMVVDSVREYEESLKNKESLAKDDNKVIEALKLFT